MNPPQPPAVGPSPVQSVLLVQLFERLSRRHHSETTSLPGHLIQCTLRGRAETEANGRRYQLQPGSVIWYHEDEFVKVRVIEAPWEFYSVNFVAPSWTPPPFEARVQHAGPDVTQLFGELLHIWQDRRAAPAVRELRVHAALLRLIAGLSTPRPEPLRMDASASLWWQVETLVRRDLGQPVGLKQLEAMTGRSQATIARSCLSAVGVPPMKRIRQIRMSLARGLLHRSDLTISEIAERVAFPRLHEFSRAYHKHYGLAPSADRPK